MLGTAISCFFLTQRLLGRCQACAGPATGELVEGRAYVANSFVFEIFT